MMRVLRRPGVLMGAYLVLYIAAGPWLSPGAGHASGYVPEVVLAAVMAWWVAARGGQVTRLLLIIWTVLSARPLLLDVSGSVPGWARLGLLCALLLKLAVLVSTPVWARTRQGAPPGWQPSWPAWPVPRPRMLLLSVGAGLLLTLAPLAVAQGDPVRLPHCPAALGALPARTHCDQLAEGMPLRFQYESVGPVVTDGRQMYGVRLAPRIATGAFAADWLMWSLGSFAALYLAWLSREREHAMAGAREPAWVT